MKRQSYHFDKGLVTGFPALCQQFTGKTLRSPYRSTVPLLSLIEYSGSQWESLMRAVGAPFDPNVHFEYGVASPKHGGNPSQTDVLVASNAGVCAVEAKWTEPRYETVAGRLRKPETDGGDPAKTVDGWLDHLRPYATRPLVLDEFLDVVYQVVHRAASACAEAAARRVEPHLVYLHFHPSPLSNSATTDQYAADLSALHRLLGSPTNLKFTVAEMSLQPTQAFEEIKDLSKRAPETSAAVVKMLCNGPLFIFGEPRIIKIGSK